MRFAGLSLNGLGPGEWRPLDEEEVHRLKTSVGLKGPVFGATNVP